MLAVIERHCSVFVFLLWYLDMAFPTCATLPPSSVGWAFLWWEQASLGTTASWDCCTRSPSSLCYGWVSVLTQIIQNKFKKHFPTYFLPHCRLTVFWRALWCLKEVSYSNERTDQILLCSLFSDICFFLSHVTGCHQWDKEERPPARIVFLWIWYVQMSSYPVFTPAATIIPGKCGKYVSFYLQCPNCKNESILSKHE